MKNLTTKISTLILILALTAGNQVKAEKDPVSPDKKEIVHVRIHAPLVKFLSEVFELKDSHVIVLNNKLDEVEGVSVYSCEQEIHIVIDRDVLEVLDLYEDYQSQQLEDWMFTELIDEKESQPLEDWMFEELVTPEEETLLEDWMFDTEYFDDDVAIEDWMLDTEYYTY